jgi:dephospho-CoA kinase
MAAGPPEVDRLLRVGLTGGVSSGKSEVGRILRELGAAVFDADRIVAGLYEPGQPGARIVAELFGTEFLSAAARVDRPRLAARVFTDPGARERLEARIHPLVAAEILRRFADAERGGFPVAAAEASQLLEGGYAKEFDRVALVVAPAGSRRKRWLDRGLDPEDLSRRMAAQLPEDAARELADDVIVNAGSLTDLRRTVETLYRSWLEETPHRP